MAIVYFHTSSVTSLVLLPIGFALTYTEIKYVLPIHINNAKDLFKERSFSTNVKHSARIDGEMWYAISIRTLITFVQ